MYDFRHVHLFQYRLEEIIDDRIFHIPPPTPSTCAWSIVRFVEKDPASLGILLEWESQYMDCLKKVKDLDFTYEQLLEKIEHDYRRVENCDGSTLIYPCGCEISTSWYHTRGYDSSNDHYDCHTCDPATIGKDRELVFPRRVGKSSWKFQNSGRFCGQHWDVNENVRKALSEFYRDPTKGAQETLQRAGHELHKAQLEPLPAFRDHY